MAGLRGEMGAFREHEKHKIITYEKPESERAAHDRWLASLGQSKIVAARFLEDPEDADSAIAQTMEDQFAAKDYDGAVTTCARNVANTIADIYGVSLSGGNGSTVQPGYQGGQSSGGSTLTDILTLVVSVVLLIVIIRSVAYVFASPCGWLWCFGGPRPPYRRRGRRGPPPPPPGGYYGGSRGPRPPRGGFGGMGGGSFGGGGASGGW